jgi:hypothetical protein
MTECRPGLGGGGVPPAYVATLMYYLEDTEQALGPTKLIPRSHRAGRPPLEREVSNIRG